MELQLLKCGKKGFIYTISIMLVFLLLIIITYTYANEKGRNFKNLALTSVGDRIGYVFSMIEENIKDILGFQIIENETNIIITDHPAQNREVGSNIQKFKEFVEKIFDKYTYLNITANFPSFEELKMNIISKNMSIKWNFQNNTIEIENITQIQNITFKINFTNCYVYEEIWSPSEEGSIFNHILIGYGNSTFYENVWLGNKDYEHRLFIRNAINSGDGGEIVFHYYLNSSKKLIIDYNKIKWDICEIKYNKILLNFLEQIELNFDKEMNLTIKDIYHNITKSEKLNLIG